MITKCLIVTLWEGGYPHEIICFVFHRLLEKTRLEPWTPREIAAALSGRTLSTLLHEMKEVYVSASALPEGLLGACFTKLEYEMKRTVQDLVKPADQAARRRWGPILERPVGETTLGDYLGKSPAANVSDWSFRVLRKIKKFIAEGGWVSRPVSDLCKTVKTAWIKRMEKDGVSPE